MTRNTCQDLVVSLDLNTEIFLYMESTNSGQLCAKNSIMCLPRWHMSCGSSKKSQLYQKPETYVIVSNSPYLRRVLVNLKSLDTECNMIQMRKCFFSLLLWKTSILKYFSCTLLQTVCFIKPCYYKSSLFQSLDPQSLFIYRF